MSARRWAPWKVRVSARGSSRAGLTSWPRGMRRLRIVRQSVGRRLKKLAESNQVLCVTHLAQVAGFAHHHYVVEKRELNGRTIAEIEELSAEARKREIGRMLSGERVTPEALKHAEQLLRLASQK